MGKSPSLRRIQADIRELTIDPSDQYHASPLENDMFEWHFTIRGASDTEFEGGIYHGRILLPPEYPFKPPHIVFLTPSGRFETHTKVCLSFSAHHPELWQPAWGIRLILEALISFLPTPADGAIGALDWTKEERRKMAKESIKFRCPLCCGDGMTCVDLLPNVRIDQRNVGAKNSSVQKTRFQEEIEKLKMLQLQNHAVEEQEEKSPDSLSESKNAGDETEMQAPLDVDAPQNLTTLTTNTTPVDPTAPKPSEMDRQQHDSVRAGPGSTLTHDASPIETSAIQTSPKRQVLSQNEDKVIAPSSSEDIVSTEATGTTQTTVVDQSVAPLEEIPPLLSDNFLNGMIAILAVLVYFLLRKAQSLVDELRSLEM